MPVGTPRRVSDEFGRRGELVRVTVWLQRGALEDLEVLCRYHYGDRRRSEVVRRAVTALLAREAVQVMRGHEVERRRAERAAEEARAVAVAREDRDVVDQEHELEQALSIARGADG
jgi:metal-responsive CopG/Arc/MetJ family transcriptional regulator